MRWFGSTWGYFRADRPRSAQIRARIRGLGTKIIRIGLTGGVASGKSTVAELFRTRAIPIIDTDQIAREVVEPGQPPLERLVERFGAGILTPDGHLDRPRLREIVFSDPKARADLEALTHPAIGTAVESLAAAAGGPYQILVIPLLVEKGLAGRVDRVLVVDCPEDLQLKRLQQRDGSTLEQARAMLSAQTSRATRLKAAHDVIHNESDLAALREQVASLHQRYLELAEKS